MRGLLDPDLEKADHDMADLELSTLRVESASYLSSTVVDASHTSLPTAKEDTDYPDGGWAAWLTVAGSFFALVCTFGQLTSFGTFQAWYSDNQLRDLPPSTISWIGSMQLWVFFFSGGFVGRIFDEYGPRVLMIPGTLILVVSIMLISICREFYQYILTQGVFFGLGVGMLFYPPLSAISTHFSKYRATALGIALAGSGVGGVVYPIMLQRLFFEVGFGWGVRIAGFICFALCSLACCMVSSRLKRRPSTNPWFDTKHLKDTKFLLVTIGSVVISLGLFVPNFYIVTYATANGVPQHIAFYTLAVLNGSGIIGRILPSHFADRCGRFNVLAPCAFVAGLATLVFWPFAHGTTAVMLFAVVYGFFSGGFNALIMPCVMQISDIRQIGTRVGMLYSILAFPSLAGGPAAGALLKHNHGSYIGVMALSGSTVIAGSLVLLWARFSVNPRLVAKA